MTTSSSSSTVSEFLDLQLKIPSYQRTSEAWNNGDKPYHLSLSVLSGYPIGAFVINETDNDQKFLMDGQQRRKALRKIRGVRDILLWKSKKHGLDPVGGTEKFKQYLLEDFLKLEDEWDDVNYNPLDENSGKKGLFLLNKLHRKVGKKKSSQNFHGRKVEFFAFEGDLAKKALFQGGDNAPPFADNNGQFEPRLIFQAVLDFAKVRIREHDGNYDDVDAFKSHILARMGQPVWRTYKKDQKDGVAPGTTAQNKYKEEIVSNWTNDNELLNIITTLGGLWHIIAHHQMPKIVFKSDEDGVEFDLPKVFSLINIAGEALHDTQIYCAEPRWSGSLAEIDRSYELGALTDELFPKLRRTENDQFTKWHYCALFRRIVQEINSGSDDFAWNWLLPEIEANLDDPESLVSGFLMTGSIFAGSRAKATWSKLCQSDKISEDEWKSAAVFTDYKKVANLLKNDPYFKQYLSSWGWVLGREMKEYYMSILFRGLRKIWLNNGSPEAGGNFASRKKFINRSRMYIDYIIYHSIGGTLVDPPKADSKFEREAARQDKGFEKKEQIEGAEQLTGWEKIEEAKWRVLLTDMIDSGTIREEDYTSRNKKPSKGNWNSKIRLLLMHNYAVRGIGKPNGSDDVHVDHIVPKSKWDVFYDGLDADVKVENNHTHNLINLCLLGGKENMTKSDKALTDPDLNTEWFKEMFEKYANIAPDDFSDYDEVDENTITKLKDARKGVLIGKFIRSRRKWFSVSTNAKANDWNA
mgnify:CR=1 FL=1